eukprot:scaffold407746_cov15-Prasinocladus_malaysianus.AAC.1
MAMEGRSAEHVVQSLAVANKERQDRQDLQVDMQWELDVLRATNLEQQERLIELQTPRPKQGS